MDGFSGAGGNVVHFAKRNKVIAIELDNKKVDLLKNNSDVYGVSDNIKFVQGDFLTEAENHGFVDVVFMSPPWGGPKYLNATEYDIFQMITPDIKQIMQVCNKITRNVILYLPRNADPDQMIALLDCAPNLQRQIEIQLYYFGSKLRTIGLFIGEMVHPDFTEVSKLLLSSLNKPYSFMQTLHMADDIENLGFNSFLTNFFT